MASPTQSSGLCTRVECDPARHGPLPKDFSDSCWERTISVFLGTGCRDAVQAAHSHILPLSPLRSSWHNGVKLQREAEMKKRLLACSNPWSSRNHPHLFSSSLNSTSYTNDSPWAESAWNKLPNKSLASILGIVIANQQQATPSFSRLLLPRRPYSPHRSPPLLEAPLHLCPPGLTSWTRGAGAAKTPFLVSPEPHSMEESSLLQETSCRS